MLRTALLICIAGTVVIAQEDRTTPLSHDQNMVLAAQVMLDSAGFSPGEIDGRAGANFGRALQAFQQRHGLTASGRLDEATAEQLRQSFKEQPAVVTYTVTEADVAGPFQPDIPADLVAQSKLPSLDYRSPLEALAEKFHTSPALLQSLNPGQSFTKAGEQITVPNVMMIDAAAAAAAGRPNGARIVVTKKTSALTVEDASGRVLFFAPVTTGSEHDPLPIGTWKVTAVDQMPVFHYNPDLFWDADPSHSKAKIPPGPNNPVGVAWIDLNKPHYGIHGTPEPSRIGYTESHGCIRLTNWDAMRLAALVGPGMKVVLQ